MNARTASACVQPSRVTNSVNGSTIASRSDFGGGPRVSGSATRKTSTMPGSMNAAVIAKTASHGRWSARISDSEPGIRPASL